MQAVVAAEAMNGDHFSRHISGRHHEALAGMPELPADLTEAVRDVWLAYHRHLHNHQEGLDHAHEQS